MKIVIETSRLIIREFDENDTGFIIEIVNSPGWLRYIGDRNIRSHHDARDYLVNGPIKSYDVHGFGLWMVIAKELDIPVGMCGFLKRETLENPDIGFAFLPQYTGVGYASESVSACLTYFAKNFHFHVVDAITTTDNTISQKVLRSAGFTFSRMFVNDKNETLNMYSRKMFGVC